MKVELIKPYGYCIGVANVIKQIHKIASSHPNEKIFCVGQVVHNQKVNDSLASIGVKVLQGDKNELIENINSGVVIFSAHGTDISIIEKAKQNEIINARNIAAIFSPTLLSSRTILFLINKVHKISKNLSFFNENLLSLTKKLDDLTCKLDKSEYNSNLEDIDDVQNVYHNLEL